jgi:WD40 repeat protein
MISYAGSDLVTRVDTRWNTPSFRRCCQRSYVTRVGFINLAACRPCEGHTPSWRRMNAITIAIDPTGTLLASASASGDNLVRLWRLSDRQTIAIFQHSSSPLSVTFSVDGRHILSGSQDNKISEWVVPKDVNSKASFHSSIL